MDWISVKAAIPSGPYSRPTPDSFMPPNGAAKSSIKRLTPMLPVRTRRAIVAAALHLLAERSFSGLSLREVTREAGIVPAAFYRHFDSMEALGLDSTYGAYLERIPAATLATVNLMSLCGLHRRLRGAIVGHLALFEMTSSIPNRRYATGLRRLGLDTPAATEFFDEHVEADAIHEQIAVVNMLGAHLRDHPADAEVAGFGVAAGTLLDNEIARQQLTCWRDDRPFLLEEVA